MFLARVEKRIVSTTKHKVYVGKTVFVVHPVLPDGTSFGNDLVAMDYIGAGIGDIVVCGGAPGVANKVFKLKLAPISTLIIAVVEKITYNDI